VPSCTHILCAATSGQYTTAWKSGAPGVPADALAVLSVAAASAPVAKTLSTRSTGARSSSARSAGTTRRAAAFSASRATRLPVRSSAKCSPS